MDKNNLQLTKINNVIFKLADRLNPQSHIWILGMSSGLMVHGINIIPHDIDTFVDDNSIEDIQKLFLEYITEPLHDYLWQNQPFREFKILIDDVEVEIIGLRQIDNKDIQKINYNNQSIPTYTLEYFLKLYKSIPGKESTVKLIEEN